jgi:hypothetical protein
MEEDLFVFMPGRYPLFLRAAQKISKVSYECAEAVLPDRAMYFPTFSHFLIVNKLLPPHPHIHNIDS